VADGADVIDVGAEATGPGSVALSHHEEWQRLELILPELVQACARLSIPPKISVDTRHAKTAEKALELGVHLINDQSALGDPKMLDVIANSDCHYSFMHQLGLPTDKTVVMADNQDRLAIIYEWALQKLTLLNSKGITPNRILFDVGIGFGKTAQQSLELIQHIAYFKSLHVNLMVGHSRKSFLSLFTTHKAAERDLETLAVSTVLLNQPVDYLRIHTVKDTAKLFKVCRALR
jgi:dihydropteroate synthase